MNCILDRYGIAVTSLEEDLKDGVILCMLVEILAPSKLKYIHNPQIPSQRFENLNIAMNRFASVGIRARGCTEEGSMKFLGISTKKIF
jgi:hypothetical protein